jgi:hypothetical protein
MPAPVKLSFTDIPSAEWAWQEVGLTLHFFTRVIDSRVEVECQLDNYSEEYFGELYRRSLDLARACVKCRSIFMWVWGDGCP